MGTNFYLRKRLSIEEKETAKSYINEDRYDELRELLPEKIHIGKRSGGWKFLWDAHYFKYFEPTKESLIGWLKSGDIFNEYGEYFTFDQFRNEELKGFLDKGYDIESYEQSNHAAPNFCKYSSRIRNFERNCKYKIPINLYGEFYIDNLRFTVSEDFG